MVLLEQNFDTDDSSNNRPFSWRVCDSSYILSCIIGTSGPSNEGDTLFLRARMPSLYESNFPAICLIQNAETCEGAMGPVISTPARSEKEIYQVNRTCRQRTPLSVSEVREPALTGLSLPKASPAHVSI